MDANQNQQSALKIEENWQLFLNIWMFLGPVCFLKDLVRTVNADPQVITTEIKKMNKWIDDFQQPKNNQ